ncbi:MAG: ribosome-associated translation inhibitor RaiA [Candidatus Paceibacterota bacterium]
MKTDYQLAVRTKTTQIEMTPSLEEYINKKMGLLKKHLSFFAEQTHDLFLDIEIARDTNHHKHGEVFSAEINFTAGKILLRAKAKAEDLYTAIDEAKDDLERELRNYANKRKTLWRKGGARIKNLIRGFRRK